MEWKVIEREHYIRQLAERRGNGMVKVITGVRRSGKSFLLFRLYRDYLSSLGVGDGQIIGMALDDDENARYRDPVRLGEHLRSMVSGGGTYYVFLDEIQKVSTVRNPYVDDPAQTIGFVDVVLGLIRRPNVDVYVTGSNSRMLSSDILTEFRGRGDEIRVFPLSFREYSAARGGDVRDAWRDYCVYGGMPYLLRLESHQAKSRYLCDLFDRIYVSDIVERNRIADRTVLDDILDVVSSSVGSLTNPSRIADTFRSTGRRGVTDDTVSRYLGFLCDAFLIGKARRYDVKGRKYIGSPYKYYFTDIGLRNARLNFRQTEENHIMENIIYIELLLRGFSVDVGTVEYSYEEGGKSRKTRLEVDFVANDGSRRYYIQSALSVGEESKRRQEVRPFARIPDACKRVVVVRDDIVPWHDESGVLYVGVCRFLLEENALEL